MKKYHTIIFDYDGTLHESLAIYQKAFLKAYDYLVEENLQPKRDWTAQEIGAFLGQNPKEMWGSFKPSLSDEVIQYVSSLIGEEMKAAILRGEAKLYDNTLYVLETLKKEGYHLVYLSNSKTYYMEAHRNAFELDQYFDSMICSEMYNYIPKKHILERVKQAFEAPMLMVGDRIHDMETGYHNRIDTVACTYGYGTEAELKDATYHISDIKELLNIL